MYTYIHAYAVHIHMHAHTNTHTHTNTHIQNTHTHTYTQITVYSNNRCIQSSVLFVPSWSPTLKKLSRCLSMNQHQARGKAKYR